MSQHQLTFHPNSRPLADLSDCDREPIHIPGHIQPQGALLAIRPEDFLVIQASANLGTILDLSANKSLGRPLHEVLGRPLQELLGNEARIAIEDFVSRDSYAPHDVLRIDGMGDAQLSLRAHRSGNLICAELEPVTPRKTAERSSITLAQTIISRLGRLTSQQALCAAAAAEFKALTGYDRVMVYQFDEDGHGEVVAEAREAALAPYLGLHYPATDIPQQARRLFIEQRVRLIGDMHYTPVPIIAHPEWHVGVPLDMTHCALRGVSPVHVEYLNNMGVKATFGVSLASSGRLWGLIVGHHESPRWMDTEQRAAVDIIGQILSALLRGLDLAAVDARAIATSKMMRAISDKLATSSQLGIALAASESELLHLLNANGALVRLSGVITAIGHLPPLPDATKALSVLHAAAGGDLLATSALGSRHVDLASCTALGSGALLLPLSGATDDAIVWFRPEFLQTITWGGNPNKPAQPDGLSGRLTPRTSFEAWKEIIRGRSLPWREVDFALARELRRLVGAAAKVYRQDEVKRAAVETSSVAALANIQLIAEGRVALAHSVAETKIGVAALIASSANLASSQEETKTGLADLLASEIALASSQAETKIGMADLLASEVLNKALGFANAVLVTSQEAMRQSEQRFSFATQAGRLGVWELDLQSWQLTATEMCKENFGRDPKAPFTFEQLRSAIDQSDKDNVRTAIDRSVINGLDLDIECKIERPDGEPGWVKLKAEVARNASATPIKIAGISLDITERVLRQERMRQSQRIEAVGRLTAGVAHDFNNVLQSLLGGIELAMDELIDQPDIRSDLEFALQAGQRGARLTSHLLSFSRQQMLHPEPVRVPYLLRELSRTLVHTFRSDINVRIDVADDLPDVLVDPTHLGSALLNLALNARDAMPDGGELRIHAHSIGNQVVIEVLDTGEGMTPEVLAKACEPFFSTKGLKGSGLGLSMVQGFARQSGGELFIRSTPGNGSQVDIRLPVVVPSTTPKLSHKPPTREYGRILVADDEADVSRVTAAFLQKAGYQVVTANGGNDALLKLAVGPKFAALVTDYAMPGMNGVDLVLDARELDPGLPALIVTGYAGAEGLENLPSDVSLLRKPFQRDVLARKVQDLLEAKRLLTG